MVLPPLLLAGDLENAKSFVDVVQRSHTIELLAAVDLAAGGVEGLYQALAARPVSAAAIWARGGREAAEIAERLSRHPGPSLLHPPPRHPPAGGAHVQIAHGWLSLAGLGALERLFTIRTVEHVRLTVRGTPEGPAAGLHSALYHAATLVHRLGRRVQIVSAVLSDETRLELGLRVDGVQWSLRVGSVGWGLEMVVRRPDGHYAWTADGVSETLQRPRAEPRVIPAAPWAERCIAQLISPIHGASFVDAAKAHATVEAAEVALGRALPPARFEVGPTAENLRALGLAGDLPDAAPLAPLPPPRPPLPHEVLAYALDLKPAVFVTVAPGDEAHVRAALPGHVQRRERRVQVAGSDRWIDDRTSGEPMVELYAARDRAVLAELVQLQVQDPSGSLTRIGAILGYPACCVQAFAALGDRSDNSYNRVAIAARTSVDKSWPGLLNDTSLKLLPHFLCTYRCERSLSQAELLLSTLQDEHTTFAEQIAAHLTGPTLYFDHHHQLQFRGLVIGGVVRYTGVAIPWTASEPFAKLGGVIAQGDRLAFTDDALEVYRGSEPLVVLRRTDPHLGVLMPFAAA